MKLSRISSRVTPFLRAPPLCTRISGGRLRQLIIARFSMLLVLRSRPSRPHTAPQQYSVTSSCIGMLKSSAALKAASTNSFPSTALRISRPFSNVALSISSPTDVRGGRSLRSTLTVLSDRSTFHLLPNFDPETSLLDLDTRPFLDNSGDRGEIRVGAELRVRDRQHLTNGGAGHHGHAERFGLVETEPHILVRETGRETEIERAW